MLSEGLLVNTPSWFYFNDSEAVTLQHSGKLNWKHSCKM